MKNLSEGNVADAVDTDEVIKYFAAHNFVLNYDSYTGNMLHNYYLYEKDGKLSMLPWDYNLAFGGFGGGAGGFGGFQKSTDSDKNASDTKPTTPQQNTDNQATSLVNTGIDSPLSGSNEESRPMWNFIAQSEEYTSQYHEVYDSLLKNYFESGKFEKEIDALYEMLLPYVEKETGAFYSADDFTQGYNTLKQFCLLRAESIRAQLDGNLATITTNQESSAQIDASSINIHSMGSMGGDKKREKKESTT